MTDLDLPFFTSEEEIIMKANSDVVSSLSDALGNVETGPDSAKLLEQIHKHTELILEYSEKLIKASRKGIRSVK